MLLVYRRFGGSNEPRLLDLESKLRECSCSPVHLKTRLGNTILGNAGWLRGQLQELGPKNLVIADPQLIGMPSVFGLVQCVSLIRMCKSRGIKIFLVLFDLHDPQGALFGFLLSRSGEKVLLTCSTPSEANYYFQIPESVGPVLPLMFKSSRSSITRRRLRERAVDVHLPRPSYEPRRTIVSSLQKELDRISISYLTGGSFASEVEFEESLSLTRIIVVTNSVVPEATGRWPLPRGPIRHLVSYNFEALRAGSLLISEKCDALNAVLVEGVHYVSFSTILEAVEKISYFLSNLDAAEEIAKSGWKYFNTLTADCTELHRLLD